MKIQVSVKELQKKMQRALGVVDAKATIPVLSNVRIDVLAANQARISASNLSLGMIQSVEIALQSDQAGSLLLPAKTLSEVLSSFPSDNQVVVDDSGDNVTTLVSKKFKAKIPKVKQELFPVIEQMPATEFSLNAGALKKLIERTEFAAPTKGGRHSVPAVLIESTVENLRAVGTDSFRIAVADAPGAGSGVFSLQLPKTVLGLLKDLPGTVISFSQSETNYFFQSEGEQILVRKSPTVFPPYQRAFKQGYVTRLAVAIPTLQMEIAAVQPFMDKDSQAFNLTVDKGEVTLRTSSLAGEGETSFDVEYPEVDKAVANAPNKLRMNPKFVSEFLSQVEGKVTVELSSDRTLAKLSSENYQYFIMPMQEKAPAAEAPKA